MMRAALAGLAALASALMLVTSCGSSSSDTGSPSGDAGAVDASVQDTASEPPPSNLDANAQPDADANAVSSDGATDGATDGALAAYPPGPYGNGVGDVFPLLQWEGYVDDLADAIATTKTYGNYSMDDVRKSGKAYALVHTSETFDPGCQNAARDLAVDGKTLVDAGAVVVEILVSKTGNAPAKVDLDAWVNAYKVPVTSMIDPALQPLASLNALGRRELAFIVDLKTMTIAKKYTGDTTGVGPSSVKMAEPDLHTLLGK